MTAIAFDMQSEFGDPRVHRAQEGDLDAFNELVEEYQGLIYGICLKVTRQPETAEDAAQETFISAWRHLSSMRADSLRAWLCRIAINASHSQMRKVRRRSETMLEEADSKESPDAGPETTALRKETQSEIAHRLAQLPAEQRDAIILWHQAGLNYHEIARAMETSTGTIKSRLYRGRRHLSRLLS